MENNTEILAEDLSNKIEYEMLKELLVKPLEPIKILREFDVPVVKDKTKDDGLEVNEYEDVTKEQREVESVFAKGIVLKVPASLTDDSIKVGDTVVYNNRFAIDFDIFKDSKLIKPYDVIAKIK